MKKRNEVRWIAMLLILPVLAAGCAAPANDASGGTTTAVPHVTAASAVTTRTTTATTTASTTAAPTTAAPTTTQVPTTTTTEENVEELSYYEALEGKTFVVFGDSTVYGHTLGVQNTWSALLAEKYGMNYQNKGLNGNGVLINNSSNSAMLPMYQRYTALPDDVDILFVMGGTNDYYKKAPLGTTSDTEATTFAGALNVLIEGLKEKYPNTLILFSTPYYKNEQQKQYCDMVQSVCTLQGVPCFYAADKEATGIRQDEADFRAEYQMSASDTDHLNRKGMELVMPVFEAYIGQQYTDYIG